MCCSVNGSVCLVCCVFVNCLVKQFAMCLGVDVILLLNIMDVFRFLLLVSSGCLTGSWSVWSHAVTPHSTIYHLVFVI